MRSALSDSARGVFIALATRGNATRPQLAAACALSKPTVSAAVAELESLGFAERSGTAYGATGRSAAVYRLGPRAGYVLAVDRGSTQVAYRAVGLDGALLDHDHTDHPESAGEMIRAALKRRADGGPLRAAVVAVSDVVAPPAVLARAAADPATDRRVRAALDALGLPASAPVVAENNVNCAAIAELHDASDGSRDTFVYLQVGVGIGAGLVVGRQLIRGANGAAGEVARLAYPWADGVDAEHEALEARLGSAGLLERAAARWPGGREAAPRTAADLFALAEDGLAPARALVEEHAAHVGKLAASLAAVLDPGMVILGGGVGGNPLLTQGVAATLGRLSWPTSVLVSTLGDQATVLGAALLARERGVQEAVEAG
jgi:predicted NBD/HSP70 family sugar kinase